MNDRLLNNPIPPREIDPSITPELQEIIYRALERNPKNRYATARDFAWDLQHQERSGSQRVWNYAIGKIAAPRGLRKSCFMLPWRCCRL